MQCESYACEYLPWVAMLVQNSAHKAQETYGAWSLQNARRVPSCAPPMGCTVEKFLLSSNLLTR
jgi:hypothetical protein